MFARGAAVAAARAVAGGPSGRFEVVRQSPAAGSTVAGGTVVTLTFVVWPQHCP